MTWHDWAWHGMTFHDLALLGITWHDLICLGMTWHDLARVPSPTSVEVQQEPAGLRQLERRVLPLYLLHCAWHKHQALCEPGLVAGVRPQVVGPCPVLHPNLQHIDRDLETYEYLQLI